MKKGPDLIAVLFVVFVLGSVMTGVSQSDLQLASIVGEMFSNS